MWLAGRTSKLVTRPAFSPDIQGLIDRYAPPNTEVERQLFELALVIANSVLVVGVTAITALVGWLTATHLGRHSLGGIYAGAVGVALCGVGVHLARYYDALIGKFTKKQRSNIGWPRRSGDLDLILQLGVGLLIGLAAAK